MNEQDLRVQRTRRLLQEAFVKLANDHDYHQITIRDITRQAQVGYKTFFRHYDSIEALAQAIIDNVLKDFAGVSSIDPLAIEKNTLVALRFAQKHNKLFMSILKSPLAYTLLQPVIAQGHRDSEQFTLMSNLPKPLLQHHFSVSVASLIQWWLENGMMHTPEEMVQYIKQLVLIPLELIE